MRTSVQPDTLPDTYKDYLAKQAQASPVASSVPIGQQVSQIPGDVYQTIRHPINTLQSLLTIPRQGNTAAVGERVPQYDPYSKVAEMYHYLPPGTVVSKANIPEALDPEASKAARQQTMGMGVGGILAALGGGPEGFVAGSYLANPQEPVRMMGDAAVLGLLGKGLGAAGKAASQVRMIPEGPINAMANVGASRAMENSVLPSSGGIPGVQAGLAMAKSVPNIFSPELGEMRRPGLEAVQDAAARDPATWNRINQMRQARQAQMARYGVKGEPSLAAGMEAAAERDLGPAYDAMRAKYPNLKLDNPASPKGITFAEAQNAAPGSEARAAFDRYTKTPAGRDLKGITPDGIIPGTESEEAGNTINDILQRPTVAKMLKKAQEDEGLGNIDPTKPVSFQNLRDVVRMIREKANAAFKANNGTLGYSLKQAGAALDAEIGRQVPEYAPVQAEWSRRMQTADAYRATVGEFKMPGSPGALTGHVPVIGASPEGLATRIPTYAALDAFRRAKAGSLGAILGSQESGTPLTINDVFARYSKGNRPGVVDLSGMSPEAKAAYESSKGARPDYMGRKPFLLGPEELKAQLERQKKLNQPSRVTPGPVEGLVP